MIKNKAFTLAELLMALGIVGIIAALVVPNFLGDINSKILLSQTKHFVVLIQNSISSQLVLNKTKSLSNTDFSSADKLFTEDNFEIIKTCNSENAQSNCWRTNNSTDKTIYKAIDGSNATLSDLDKEKTVILKNGVMFSYQKKDDKINILFDVNGPESPNIAGKDLFQMTILDDGNIETSEVDTFEDCEQGAPDECFQYLLNNNWNI